MDPLVSILRKRSLLGGAQIVSSLVAMVLMVVVSRTLGDVEFGRLYLALTLSAIVGVVVDVGLSQVVTRVVAREPALARPYHLDANGAVVQGNQVTGNKQDGIELTDSHSDTLSGNTVTGNADGITLSVGSSDNVVSGNTVASNTGNGLNLYQGSTAPSSGDGRPQQNRFTGNTVRDNTAYAAGLAIFFSVLSFMGAGWALDHWLGTRWLMVTGIVLGAAVGLFEFVRIISRIDK